MNAEYFRTRYVKTLQAGVGAVSQLDGMKLVMLWNEGKLYGHYGSTMQGSVHQLREMVQQDESRGAALLSATLNDVCALAKSGGSSTESKLVVQYLVAQVLAELLDVGRDLDGETADWRSVQQTLLAHHRLRAELGADSKRDDSDAFLVALRLPLEAATARAYSATALYEPKGALDALRAVEPPRKDDGAFYASLTRLLHAVPLARSPVRAGRFLGQLARALEDELRVSKRPKGADAAWAQLLVSLAGQADAAPSSGDLSRGFGELAGLVSQLSLDKKSGVPAVQFSVSLWTSGGGGGPSVSVEEWVGKADKANPLVVEALGVQARAGSLEAADAGVEAVRKQLAAMAASSKASRSGGDAMVCAMVGCMAGVAAKRPEAYVGALASLEARAVREPAADYVMALLAMAPHLVERTTLGAADEQLLLEALASFVGHEHRGLGVRAEKSLRELLRTCPSRRPAILMAVLSAMANVRTEVSREAAVFLVDLLKVWGSEVESIGLEGGGGGKKNKATTSTSSKTTGGGGGSSSMAATWTGMAVALEAGVMVLMCSPHPRVRSLAMEALAWINRLASPSTVGEGEAYSKLGSRMEEAFGHAVDAYRHRVGVAGGRAGLESLLPDGYAFGTYLTASLPHEGPALAWVTAHMATRVALSSKEGTAVCAQTSDLLLQMLDSGPLRFDPSWDDYLTISLEDPSSSSTASSSLAGHGPEMDVRLEEASSGASSSSAYGWSVGLQAWATGMAVAAATATTEAQVHRLAAHMLARAEGGPARWAALDALTHVREELAHAVLLGRERDGLLRKLSKTKAGGGRSEPLALLAGVVEHAVVLGGGERRSFRRNMDTRGLVLEWLEQTLSVPSFAGPAMSSASSSSSSFSEGWWLRIGEADMEAVAVAEWGVTSDPSSSSSSSVSSSILMEGGICVDRMQWLALVHASARMYLAAGEEPGLPSELRQRCFARLVSAERAATVQLGLVGGGARKMMVRRRGSRVWERIVRSAQAALSSLAKGRLFDSDDAGRSGPVMQWVLGMARRGERKWAETTLRRLLKANRSVSALIKHAVASCYANDVELSRAFFLALSQTAVWASSSMSPGTSGGGGTGGGKKKTVGKAHPAQPGSTKLSPASAGGSGGGGGGGMVPLLEHEEDIILLCLFKLADEKEEVRRAARQWLEVGEYVLPRFREYLKAAEHVQAVESRLQLQRQAAETIAAQQPRLLSKLCVSALKRALKLRPLHRQMQLAHFVPAFARRVKLDPVKKNDVVLNAFMDFTRDLAQPMPTALPEVWQALFSRKLNLRITLDYLLQCHAQNALPMTSSKASELERQLTSSHALLFGGMGGGGMGGMGGMGGLLSVRELVVLVAPYMMQTRTNRIQAVHMLTTQLLMPGAWAPDQVARVEAVFAMLAEMAVFAKRELLVDLYPYLSVLMHQLMLAMDRAATPLAAEAARQLLLNLLYSPSAAAGAASSKKEAAAALPPLLGAVHAGGEEDEKLDRMEMEMDWVGAWVQHCLWAFSMPNAQSLESLQVCWSAEALRWAVSAPQPASHVRRSLAVYGALQNQLGVLDVVSVLHALRTGALARAHVSRVLAAWRALARHADPPALVALAAVARVAVATAGSDVELACAVDLASAVSTRFLSFSPSEHSSFLLKLDSLDFASFIGVGVGTTPNSTTHGGTNSTTHGGNLSKKEKHKTKESNKEESSSSTTNPTSSTTSSVLVGWQEYMVRGLGHGTLEGRTARALMREAESAKRVGQGREGEAMVLSTLLAPYLLAQYARKATARECTGAAEALASCAETPALAEAWQSYAAGAFKSVRAARSGVASGLASEWKARKAVRRGAALLAEAARVRREAAALLVAVWRALEPAKKEPWREAVVGARLEEADAEWLAGWPAVWAPEEPAPAWRPLRVEPPPSKKKLAASAAAMRLDADGLLPAFAALLPLLSDLFQASPVDLAAAPPVTIGDVEEESSEFEETHFSE